MIYKILLADDNDEALKGFCYQLKNFPEIRPVIAQSAEATKKLITENPNDFAVVVLDYHFLAENVTGADLAKDILKKNPNLLIIICTGDDSSSAVVSSLRAKVKDFISKDDVEGFINAIKCCLPIYDEYFRILSKENRPLKAQHEDNFNYIKKFGLVSRSDQIRKVCETIEKAKDAKATALIKGESGTGKELVARAFHLHSQRKNENFVAINCAAIPANLLESELFGYKKGAFTGAATDTLGKFEQAHKGTIFLDEIGDMSLELQSKLLRVLQDGTFYPVGSRLEVKVDVRVLAATNVDLAKAIESGKFREDLYYRLRVLEVTLPPLRERKEDIEPLVLHFQNKYGKNKDAKILYKTFSVLNKYSWPGNVRELENTVESLFALAKDQNIGPENLPHYFFDYPANKLAGFEYEITADYPSFQKAIEKFIQQREYEFIMSRVKVEKSIRNAADKLKISKSTLQRKLASYGYGNFSNDDNKKEAL